MKLDRAKTGGYIDTGKDNTLFELLIPFNLASIILPE